MYIMYVFKISKCQHKNYAKGWIWDETPLT